MNPSFQWVWLSILAARIPAVSIGYCWRRDPNAEVGAVLRGERRRDG